MGMREIAPFGVRMPPQLKARLEVEAKANGRSMNTEVVARLWASLQDQNRGTQHQATASPTVPAYLQTDLSDVERQLLAVFRRMAIEKQLALVSLLK